MLSSSKKKPAFFPGTRIGPYSLVRELGKGTFGVVWLAERRGRLATTRVALKSPVGLNDRDLQFLIRESEIWIRSSGHPNVMPVIEAEDYDGVVVIVTEYAQDGSLETWLEKHQYMAPSIDAGVSLAVGILTGLDYLHQRGVIHRDLKPANILLQGGIPRITDFGLARLNNTAKHSYSIAGTPEYMSPEAWRGNRSEQTDIWSVGVMLYEMLSGQSPFPTENWDVLRHAVEFCEPAPLPESVPTRVQNAILTALQKDPNKRFRSAEEMAIQLRDSSPMSSVITDTITSGLGGIQDKLRDLENILQALENFSPNPTSHFYIGNTLMKCATFLEDNADGDPVSAVAESLIEEVEAHDRNQTPAEQRLASLSKVRELIRFFKQMQKDYQQKAQRMTTTMSFA